MSSITIPEGIKSAFIVGERSRVCDEDGNVLGYYTPIQEGTAEDYVWAHAQFTEEEIEAARKSGPGRLLADVLADLRLKYGP